MECPVCHNKMEHKLIRHILEWKGHVVMFERVPALVCSVCKEALFSPKNVEAINEMLWSMPKASRKDQVDVYELSGS